MLELGEESMWTTAGTSSAETEAEGQDRNWGFKRRKRRKRRKKRTKRNIGGERGTGGRRMMKRRRK
jgi:hypothetical protein